MSLYLVNYRHWTEFKSNGHTITSSIAHQCIINSSFGQLQDNIEKYYNDGWVEIVSASHLDLDYGERIDFNPYSE